MWTTGKFVLFMLVIHSAAGSSVLRPTKHEDEALECDYRSTMPIVKLGKKFYYFGTFFQLHWFKAFQFCRYHGMHLATVMSKEENEHLKKYIYDLGYGNENFWLSGTDAGSEGKFFWMSTGTAITFSDWFPGNPDNYLHPNAGKEDCLHFWNRDEKLQWNDAVCSNPMYFICESL